MSIQASLGITGHKKQNAVRDRKIKTTFLTYNPPSGSWLSTTGAIGLTKKKI